LSKETYLPAWIFDYSTDFYKPFDDFRKSISSSFVEIPSLEEIKMLHYDQPLSIMIQFDINLPIQWKSSLHIWEQEFYDRLLMRKRSKENNRLCLPDIFLEILSHFLQMVHNETDTYHPKKYSKFFFYTALLDLWLGLYNRIHFFAFREAETLIGLTYKFCLSPNTQENLLH